MPSNPLAARAWSRFGVGSDAAIGTVLVFWRGSRSGWQGHVGFYAGEDESAFHVLGGNQTDAVTVARIGKDRLLSMRWPQTAPPPEPEAIDHPAGGALSTNES